jgi:hypothetical protein
MWYGDVIPNTRIARALGTFIEIVKTTMLHIGFIGRHARRALEDQTWPLNI